MGHLHFSGYRYPIVQRAHPYLFIMLIMPGLSCLVLIISNLSLYKRSGRIESLLQRK